MKDSVFRKCSGDRNIRHMLRSWPRSLSATSYNKKKKILKWIKFLNIKQGTVKLPGESIEEMLQDRKFSNDPLGLGKTNEVGKWDLIKPCTAEVTTDRVQK